MVSVGNGWAGRGKAWQARPGAVWTGAERWGVAWQVFFTTFPQALLVIGWQYTVLSLGCWNVQGMI